MKMPLEEEGESGRTIRQSASSVVKSTVSPGEMVRTGGMDLDRLPWRFPREGLSVWFAMRIPPVILL